MVLSMKKLHKEHQYRRLIRSMLMRWYYTIDPESQDPFNFNSSMNN